jgi:organic hydroperoxide reductase OsmC/OhrA
MTTAHADGVHTYRVSCHWTGNTAVGYEEYNRAHDATVEPISDRFRLSADPAFRGDPSLLNPEQLVVLAASSCQLLSFLSVAARARIEVLEYSDVGEGTMREDDPPVRIALIELRPMITVAAGTSEPQVIRLVEVAHRECFIANSLRTDIRVIPTVVVAPVSD